MNRRDWAIILSTMVLAVAAMLLAHTNLPATVL